MWTSLVLLWSVPFAAALLILLRAAEGRSAASWTVLFGETNDLDELPLSPWMALKFGLFAIVFFVVGVLQGLVFVNFGIAGKVLAPLLTGVGAMLLIAHWGRSGVRRYRLHRHTFGSTRGESRNSSILSREYRRLRRAILP
jgi:hypothetical protein